jgi:hypothetical protein
MDLRGQRFTVDLSDDDDERGSDSRIPSSAAPSIPGAFIGDIQERASTTPPTAPKLKSSTSGFPEHKKRTRVSAFKQQRSGSTVPVSSASHKGHASPRNQTPPTNRNKTDPNFDEEERKQIDVENNRRLASMSAEEIDEERQELLSALDPSLIERLLKRANLDQGRGDTGIEKAPTKVAEQEEKEQSILTKVEDVAVSAPKPTGKPVATPKSVRFEDDEAPTEPIELQPVSNIPCTSAVKLMQPSIHFPSAPQAPELDPSDPEFFENLHKQYFPSLPADPSKLAWAAPIPTHGSLADQESPYYPGLDGVAPSALRFGFRGGVLPPRIARAVPVTKGLHHHGEAPEAAGYTIPELARLSRSAFPAQRSMAFQTLGRIMYRLGRGDFNQGGGELVKGIRKCLEDGKVTQTLEEAASAEGGHQASKAHATMALWLQHIGGRKDAALKAS